MPQRGLTALGLVFHWDSVPDPDAPSGLYVLHVFAAATGAKSPLLPTSIDSRVQIRPFCTRRSSLMLSRTAARTRSARGASQFASGYTTRATSKLQIIRLLTKFRVKKTTTLKTHKYLLHSVLQVALYVGRSHDSTGHHQMPGRSWRAGKAIAAMESP